MPKADPTNPQPLPKSLAMTALLDDNNKIYYYNGDFNDAIKSNQIFETNYSTYAGLGKAIRQKQKKLESFTKFGGKNGLMLIIKPTSASGYKNVIDALDELMINDVRKYAIVDPAPEEIEYIKSKKTSRL